DEGSAGAQLRRWMAGNETVKDLEKHAKVLSQKLVYFPMWRFVAAQPQGDTEFSEPAASFLVADIKTIPLSGGSLHYFDAKKTEGLDLMTPDILLDSAIRWLQQRQVQADSIRETNLIHIPFHYFQYDYKGKKYQVIVDGISGRILASIYPPKETLPFVMI